MAMAATLAEERCAHLLQQGWLNFPLIYALTNLFPEQSPYLKSQKSSEEETNQMQMPLTLCSWPQGRGTDP